VPAVRQALT
jgi:hypothetical protein